MTFCSRSALFLVSGAVLAACGGRSQLGDSSGVGPGSSGSGPASSSASASTGGVGGAGGSGGGVTSASSSASSGGGEGGSLPMGCVADGLPIGVAGTEGYKLDNPVFVNAGNDSTATLVANWIGGADPNNYSYELRHTTFSPWGAWPADGTVGPSFLADYAAGSFVAARSKGGFGLLMARSPESPELPYTLDYLSPLTPGSGAIPPLVQQSATYSTPLFLTQGEAPSAHLLGFENNTSSPASVTLFLYDDQTSTKMVLTGLGCSSTSVQADAAKVPGGYVVAYSSGTAPADPACNMPGGAFGPAVQVNVLRVNNDGTAAPPMLIDDGSAGLITRIQVVPRSDGAWIVWTHESGQLSVARVDSQGATVAGPFLSPLFGEPHELSATSLGGHLVLAFPSPAQVVATHVRVQITDDNGFELTSTLLEATGPVQSRIALLGSPSQKSLLVAWMQLLGQEGREVRIARLGCVLR